MSDVLPETIDAMKNYINGTRSRFLSVSSNIENQLEIILADYFTRGDFDEYRLFSKLFYGREAELTFSKKILIFKKFLKKIYPEYLEKNTDFINSLERVRKLRNKFAHYILPQSDDLKQYVDKPIFPLFYIDEGILKQEEFPIKDVVARFQDFQKLLGELENLMKHCRKIYQSKSK